MCAQTSLVSSFDGNVLTLQYLFPPICILFFFKAQL